MVSVGALIEKLLESPVSDVNQAGEQLRRILTNGELDSRYVSQVADRAINDEYETLEEVFAALQGLVDPEPPILESKRQPSADRFLFPEIKILQVHSSSFEAFVTTGPLRDREILIQSASPILSYFWLHATIAAYNLTPLSDHEFASCADT